MNANKYAKLIKNMDAATVNEISRVLAKFLIYDVEECKRYVTANKNDMPSTWVGCANMCADFLGVDQPYTIKDN
jgi:hypothetical protein